MSFSMCTNEGPTQCSDFRLYRPFGPEGGDAMGMQWDQLGLSVSVFVPFATLSDCQRGETVMVNPRSPLQAHVQASIFVQPHQC